MSNNETLRKHSLEMVTAKKLIRRLEDERIPFQFETDDSGIKLMQPGTARRGGTFGLGARITFYVHQDYSSSYDAVATELLQPHQSSLRETKRNWRDRLRGR